MKNSIAFLSLLFCLLSAQKSLAQNHKWKQNLLDNPGFDSGSSKGWHKLMGGPGASASIAPSAFAHSGGCAFALRSAAIWQTVQVVPGIKYTMRVWAKATAADNSAYVRFNIFGSNGPLGSKVVYVNSIDYQEYVVEIIAPADAARIDAIATAGGAATALFVDDFCLTTSFVIATPDETNLLCNGGFEQDFANWEGWVSGYSRTSSAGEQSVAFCENQDFCQTRPATSGQKLTLCFKTQGSTFGARLSGYLKYLSDDQQTLAFQSLECVPAMCPYWELATFSETAPAGTAWVEVGFFMPKRGCVLVDEIYLGQTGSAPQAANDDDLATAEQLPGPKISPNPASESAVLDMTDFLGKENVQVAIFDGKGLIVKILAFEKVVSSLEEIALADLQNGIYFVHFVAPNQRPATAKLVVQHKF